MDEIRIQEVSDIRIGQVEDKAAGTGCTVFIRPEGMRAGLDVGGGGPASRESKLLDPLTAANIIHGITLSGGEPFLQPAPLTKLARQAHARGLDIWSQFIVEKSNHHVGFVYALRLRHRTRAYATVLSDEHHANARPQCKVICEDNVSR